MKNFNKLILLSLLCTASFGCHKLSNPNVNFNVLSTQSTIINAATSTCSDYQAYYLGLSAGTGGTSGSTPTVISTSATAPYVTFLPPSSGPTLQWTGSGTFSVVYVELYISSPLVSGSPLTIMLSTQELGCILVTGPGTSSVPTNPITPDQLTLASGGSFTAVFPFIFGGITLTAPTQAATLFGYIRIYGVQIDGTTQNNVYYEQQVKLVNQNGF